MSCSYSIYLIIMHFNPRIESWLYKITNTNSPEFKSALHASIGIKANNYGYQKIADEEQTTAKEKRRNHLVLMNRQTLQRRRLKRKEMEKRKRNNKKKGKRTVGKNNH